MLTRNKLNKYIQDSIDSGIITEDLSKSLNKFYKQIDRLLNDNKRLISDKNKWYSALMYYALANHIKPNDIEIQNDNSFEHLGSIAIEAGKIARNALNETGDWKLGTGHD